MKQYEGMFLFDPAFSAEFGKVKEEIKRILDRAGADILFLEKWDERKLAYDIDGRKRGLYVITFFKCEGGKVVGIERDAQLSEAILRLLITSAEGVTPELMKRYIPHLAAEEKKVRAAAEKEATAAAAEKEATDAAAEAASTEAANTEATEANGTEAAGTEAASTETTAETAAPGVESETAVAVAEPEVEEKKPAEGDAPAADQPAE